MSGPYIRRIPFFKKEHCARETIMDHMDHQTIWNRARTMDYTTDSHTLYIEISR
jgi:hypothetical protein